MIELKGKYNTANVFTDNLENGAVTQIINLLDQEFVKDSKIRIMPDAHAGAGCTIGTTMTIKDKVVPNLVGVDIGCGMETLILENDFVELEKLDKTIHFNIPSGFSIRKTGHPLVSELNLDRLRCIKNVNINRANLSLGTLGGGNHFIELNKDDEGTLYLVIHTGSRNLGKQAAEYYQKTAAHMLSGKITKELAFAEGELFDDYIHDMEIIQHFAELNRKAIADEIVRHMKFKVKESFTTIHNYIELNSMILRKGAISAQNGERVLIPINMRDGSLICIGKGNPDWNYSAPHGAGRLMSRTVAKSAITLSQFKKSMEGIYSSTVNKSTIDEAPFAYKPIEEILSNIQDTVSVKKIIKPLYNFKAAE